MRLNIININNILMKIKNIYALKIFILFYFAYT